jgi:ubiquinone/menaquinone biosynthesis C-methylase UbiE
VKKSPRGTTPKSQAPGAKPQTSGPKPPEGTDGWDDYAPFYDWENARTFGRRDIAFWQRLVTGRAGRVLELGCGTGRVTVPLGRTGAASVVGIDRSAAMLDRGHRRVRRARLSGVSLLRGDIRRLPFRQGSFDTVIAPYGILQSLLREPDLSATLTAVAGVLKPGGVFGLELVADLPAWKEYQRRVTMRGRRGRAGRPITLFESVRQDAERGLTFFDQEFVEGRGKSATRQRFTLTFRTVSIPQMARRLEQAGFDVTAVLGDYRGGPWDPRAEVWILLATKKGLEGLRGLAS